MALRRILHFFAHLFLICGLARHAPAQQMTSITATSVNSGGSAVSGQICFTAIDSFGNPIAVSRSGGGFFQALSASAPGYGFCQKLADGALQGSLSVPNPLTDSAPGHGYAMTIYDQNLGVWSDPIRIYSIGGSTWSLDTYIPPSTTPTTPAFTFTNGSGSHPASCTAPAIDARVNNGVVDFAICSGGAFLSVSSSSSTFTGGTVANPTIFSSTVTLAGDPQSALQAATKGYVDTAISNMQTGTQMYQGAYQALTTYTAGQIVTYNGNTYEAILQGVTNQGFTPSSSPYAWQPFGAGYAGAYASPTPYAAGAIVTYNGQSYLSLIGSNQGNTPSSSPSDWQILGSNVTVNGKTGANITLAAPDVNAAQAPDSGSRFATLANNLIATDHFYFSDGTNGWYAGETYTSEGMYGEDTIQTMLAFPGHFASADFLNIVTKFLAAKKVSGDSNPSTLTAGDLPQSLLPSGAAGQFCSGLDLYCHLGTGGGKIAVPLALYLYWQRTGDLTPYTNNVAAIKTALALIPVNNTTGCVYVTAGQEDIPGNGYMEYMRGTGNEANPSVWYAWDYKALALMATAAGDSSNASTFNTAVTSLTNCLKNTLTDGTSNLLWFADGQSKQLDIADSTLAIYPLLGSANGTLLTGSQATAISTWLNSNYSSLVNAEGYVKLINACNSGQVGAIPSGGGPTYLSFEGNSLTGYQCGYWATFGGYFAYALSLTNPAKASTYLSAYVNSAQPTTEYYNQGSTTPAGDPALMTTAQSMRQASESFPTPPASVDVVASEGYTLLAAAPAVGASCPLNNTIIGVDSTHLYVCALGAVVAATLNGPTFTAPTYVQTCTTAASSGSTNSVSCTMTVNAGDFAFVMCRGGSDGDTYTATSSPSNTFTPIAGDEAAGSSQASYAFGLAGGSTTFTCTNSTAQVYQTMQVLEYQPGSITSLAASAPTAIASNTSTFTSASINTTGPTFVISCADADFAGTSPTPGTINGTAANNRTVNSSGESYCEDLALASSQTGVTATLSTSNAGWWEGVIAAFH